MYTPPPPSAPYTSSGFIILMVECIWIARIKFPPSWLVCGFCLRAAYQKATEYEDPEQLETFPPQVKSWRPSPEPSRILQLGLQTKLWLTTLVCDSQPNQINYSLIAKLERQWGGCPWWGGCWSSLCANSPGAGCFWVNSVVALYFEWLSMLTSLY